MNQVHPSHIPAPLNIEHEIFFASHIEQKNPSTVRFITPSKIMPAVMEFMPC